MNLIQSVELFQPVPQGAVPPMRADLDVSAAGVASTGYVSPVQGLGNAVLLGATYYDDYTFLGLERFAAIKSLPGCPPVWQKRRTLVTGTLTGVLKAQEIPSNTDLSLAARAGAVASLTVYDSEERPVTVLSTTLSSSRRTAVSTEYAPGGMPLRIDQKVYDASGAVSLHNTMRYVYDRHGRQVEAYASFDSGTEMKLNSVEFDRYGRVARSVTDRLGTAMTYDIRGWLTGIESPLFNQRIGYTSGEDPQYGGNVSEMREWIGNDVLAYNYRYDDANRLTEAESAPDTPDFSCEYLYNLNSAPVIIWRHAPSEYMGISHLGCIDLLGIRYEGNRLVNVTDNGAEALLEASGDFVDGATGSGEEYAYDANGNMVRDDNRGIRKIVYNCINQPSDIVVGKYENQKMHYDYAADGRKLATYASETLIAYPSDPKDPIIPVIPINKAGISDSLLADPVPGQIILPEIPVRISPVKLRREYVDNMEYVDGKLSRINTPYGYYNAADSLFYAYQTDRQGNIRTVFKVSAVSSPDSNNGTSLAEAGGESSGYELIQSNFYYPYGMLMPLSQGQNENPYKFGGKEYETRFGLNLYDFVARGYDPALGIFLRPDPKAFKYNFVSCYNYSFSNPIFFTDFIGLGPFERIRYGRQFIGTEYKQETVSRLRTENTPEALQYMDCAEFVCRVLDGDNITKGVLHKNTAGLKTFFSDKSRFSHSMNPVVGDIVLWEGHTGIVTEVGDGGKIKVLHARRKGALLAENAYVTDPSKYCSGKLIGYYHPIEEDSNSGNAIILPEVVVTGKSEVVRKLLKQIEPKEPEVPKPELLPNNN